MINLEVRNFKKIFLKYIPNKLFNRIIRSSWRSLILLFELKYFRRILIIFVKYLIFLILLLKVIQELK